uniref:Uncharacterized protein n=1 Tax=Siphoviridae sp. ctOsn3 TaxID=2823577 RepID=A0A8S5LGD7_9CAUD|nr:MAG TPA: hypothetical protein [Siphoviridae sp. ctOsn3]
MNEKKVNGLYLSYRDFINDYASELQAWQNNYPDGTELDYLYALEEESAKYYYYSKNEGSMFPFNDKIRIYNYSSYYNSALNTPYELPFHDFAITIQERVRKYIIGKGSMSLETLNFIKESYEIYIGEWSDSYILNYETLNYYSVFLVVNVIRELGVIIRFDTDKYKNFEYSARRIVAFIQNRINQLEGKDTSANTSINVKVVPTEMPTSISASTNIENSISTSTKIEGVTWEGSESDLLELFKTLKTLGKVEYNADNDTELLPILKATFEGVNSGVTWKGSENEFYELFKALWLCKYIKPFENTDVSLFKFLGGAMGKDIRALGQMKQRNADKKRYLCDELIKEDITKELKELLKTIRAKFYDFVNE